MHHFVVTSYQYISFGRFGANYYTGFASAPILTSPPLGNSVTLPPLPHAKGALQPNSTQLLAYWMRCSQGGFRHEWVTPADGSSRLSSRQSESGDDGEDRRGDFAFRDAIWQPQMDARSRGACRKTMPSHTAVNRKVRRLGEGIVGDDGEGEFFTGIRTAQISQSIDYDDNKGGGIYDHIIRTFKDEGMTRRIRPYAGGEDVYEPVPMEDTASVCEAGSRAGDDGVGPSDMESMRNYVKLGMHFIDLRPPPGQKTIGPFEANVAGNR